MFSLILGKISRSGTDGLYGVMFNFVHNFQRCSELIPFSIPVSNVLEPSLQYLHFSIDTNKYLSL